MKKLIYLLLLATAASCGVSKKETTEPIEGSIDEELLQEQDTVITERPVYRSAETILTDLIHTKLEVNFDWTKSRMNGTATITAKPHFYSSDSLILDAKGMDINWVKTGPTALNYSYDGAYLKIKLDKIYKRSEQYTVVISYVAKPDERETGGSAAITSDKGLYFINPTGADSTVMPQIWTQGETEASSVWFPTIDAPNAKTTQEIFITVENKYSTLSNGKLIAQKNNGDGTRTDHWKQELPHAPYLFMMGIGEFKVVKDFYTRPDGTKMEVNYYVEPEWEPHAKAIFGETPNMIKHFSQLLGYEYPWDKYHQIVVRDYVSGAMENTGAVIFGDFVYKNDRELLDGNDQSTIAHELFHHWFGDLVTCESWSNLPLNESFANYSQYLWDEHRFGVDEADYQAESEADGYYQSAQMSGYHDLIWFDYDDKEQMFDGHSYNKGGRILHMLRNHLGDEAFFAGIKLYLNANKFKPAEFHQLRLAFEEVSGQDLNWFFDQWFLASGHPVINVNQEIDAENGKIVLIMEQKQNLELSPIFRIPMEVAVFDDSGKKLYPIIFDQLKQRFEFPFSGTVKNVIFDHQQMLLAKVREEKPQSQFVHQYYNGVKYRARRDGLLQGTKSKSQEAQQLILDALSDKFWDIRLIAIEKSIKLDADNKVKGLELIKKMATSDENSQVRSAALNYLSNNADAVANETIYTDRIKNDKSYSVISTALRNLGKSNPGEALLLAKNLEQEKSSKMQTGIAQLYGSHGGKEHFTFFRQILKSKTLQGFDQLGVLNSLTFYVTRQDVEIAEQSIELYSYLKRSGGYYTKMFLSQNVSYLLEKFEEKIRLLQEEIDAHEKNKNTLYADQARKQKAVYEKLVDNFALLLVE